MSEENDSLENETQDEDFATAAELTPEEESSPRAKRSGGLKFLTFLMMVLGLALFVLPFVWGGEFKDRAIIPDSSVLNDWLWWLGDMHVVVLHLPIGIFFYAFAMEILGLLSFRKFKPHLGATLFFAALSSIVSVVFGYFYFLRADYGPAELSWDLENNNIGMHMWLSILASFFVILSFLSKMWSRHHEKWSFFYPLFMLFAASTMILGAHMGARLVHKNKDVEGDFLKLIACEPLGVCKDEIAKIPDVTGIPAGERLVYAQIVKPILQGKCWECHAGAELNPLGKDKIKGDLDMTTVAKLLAGGEGGEELPVLVPGDSKASEMMIRVHLDPDDEDFMPCGKEDEPEAHLTDGEKKILGWWIDQETLMSEENDQVLAELAGHESILAAVEAFEPAREVEAIKEVEAKEEAPKLKEEKAVESESEPEEPVMETNEIPVIPKLEEKEAMEDGEARSAVEAEPVVEESESEPAVKMEEGEAQPVPAKEETQPESVTEEKESEVPVVPAEVVPDAVEKTVEGAEPEATPTEAMPEPAEKAVEEAEAEPVEKAAAGTETTKQEEAKPVPTPVEEVEAEEEEMPKEAQPEPADSEESEVPLPTSPDASEKEVEEGAAPQPTEGEEESEEVPEVPTSGMTPEERAREAIRKLREAANGGS